MRSQTGVGEVREFIGHKIKVATRSMGAVEGLLVDDRKDMILLKGNDGKIFRIIKTDIGCFVPMDFEPFEFVPFHVLFCRNKRMPCPGVQYVKEGQGFTRKDLDEFVGPCPCREDDCEMGTKGELRTVSGDFLREMLGGTLFGTYPQKEGEKKHGGESGSSGATETAPSGEGQVRRTGEGAEQADGRTGGTSSPDDGTGGKEPV